MGDDDRPNANEERIAALERSADRLSSDVSRLLVLFQKVMPIIEQVKPQPTPVGMPVSALPRFAGAQVQLNSAGQREVTPFTETGGDTFDDIVPPPPWQPPPPPETVVGTGDTTIGVVHATRSDGGADSIPRDQQ
jgi:hypothetical protein